MLKGSNKNHRGNKMSTRVYDKKIDINNEDTRSFWLNRACGEVSLKTVLLGVDKAPEAQDKRNKKEADILNNIISDFSELKILDIGCGIGRWADNLKDKLDFYTGIDYSKGFIEYAKNRFASNNKIEFYEMSACDIDKIELSKEYNLIICTGVLMYINDEDISRIFQAFKRISPEYVYIQESISLMDGRLTLDNFKSKALKANYSAIYRTKAEYEEYYKQNDFRVLKTDLLLDDETGGRKETNAQYWILKG